jgi:hypothetical protein
MPALRSILVLAPVLALTAATVPDAPARETRLEVPAGHVRVDAVYSSSVLLLTVGEISLQAEFSPSGYDAQAYVEAAGLAALFTDFDIRAEVEGRRGSSGARPDRYAHVERTGRKVRSVEVSFGTGAAVSVAEPPFGSLGQPPASAADRTGVIDPMTAFFRLSDRMSARGGPGCSGRLPVFDGKQRYNLRLEDGGTRQARTRAWRGEVRVCNAYYEPISGYDPEDYPSASELRHPLSIWIAHFPEAGVSMPVRLHTRAGLGGVTIEATSLEFLGAE